MFEISMGEFLLVGIVALLVLGPEELPNALRTLGKWVRTFKTMASSVQSQVHTAMNEVDIAKPTATDAPVVLEQPAEHPPIFSDDLAATWNAQVLHNEQAAITTLLPPCGGAVEHSETEGGILKTDKQENPSPAPSRHPLPPILRPPGFGGHSNVEREILPPEKGTS